MTHPSERIGLRAATDADRDRLGAMLREYQAEIAVLSEGAEGSWYPKLVGPERTVKHWESSYRRFLTAVRPAGD